MTAGAAGAILRKSQNLELNLNIINLLRQSKALFSNLISAILVAAAKCLPKWPLLWNWLHVVSSARTFPCQRSPVGTHPHHTAQTYPRSARAPAPNGKALDKGEEGHP